MKKRMSEISFEEWARLGPAAALEARQSDVNVQREILTDRFNLWMENARLRSDKAQASTVDLNVVMAAKAGTVGRS